MRGRNALATLAAVAATLIPAAPAHAVLEPVLDVAASCPSVESERVFMRWLDPMLYALVPGGSFESGTPGWTLDGASVAGENEPFHVNDPGDTHSLALPPGSTVTSPTICGRLDTLTLRFFVRSAGLRRRQVASGLRVEALTQTVDGALVALRLGQAAPGSRWGPTRPFAVAANALVPIGETAPVAFRFTSVGGASWRIDDVYVDPFFRG